MGYELAFLIAIVALLSIMLSPLARIPEVFFGGQSPAGRGPGLWTLTFSMVTSWLLARSLLNAALLGFFFGVWGVLACAAYYLSFWVANWIISRIRFEQGYSNIQTWLYDRFGAWGPACYNFIAYLRLISEVAGSLLVVGVLIGSEGSGSYILAVLGVALVTLTYSLMGGMSAALRTDLFQWLIFAGITLFLVLLVAGNGNLEWRHLLREPFSVSSPGPVLLAAVMLQIWSFPLHDPVLMDRGFLAGRDVTRQAYAHAGWIGVACIVLFGALGVLAGGAAAPGEPLLASLQRLLGTPAMFLFSSALIVVAMAGIDGALASSARLMAVDMRAIMPNLANGRLAMVITTLLGLIVMFLGRQDPFMALALSGIVSMYLSPVVFFSLLNRREDIPAWSYVSSCLLALAGALLYFLEARGQTGLMGEMHNHTRLLLICFGLFAGCNLLFWIGGRLAYAVRMRPQGSL
ncbi:MAG: hypothetical protein KDI15_07485 [Thiothrix sp.]|nr:hypothetical protein [Thiothrix sp.]HPE59056.1 hypothetical protein [Thiolinea sp.]